MIASSIENRLQPKPAAYRVAGQYGSPLSRASVDKSFSAPDCGELARQINNIAYNCSNDVLMANVNTIKSQLEGIINIMDKALVTNGKIFLKLEMIELYNNVYTMMQQIDANLENYAVTPAVNYCNQEQERVNSLTWSEASGYQGNFTRLQNCDVHITTIS